VKIDALDAEISSREAGPLKTNRKYEEET